MPKRRSGYVAAGEVYNVRERMSEENGIPGEWDDYPDWYEYEMFLIDPDGEIVSQWDSLTETYNGFQMLTKADAERSAKEVEDDVKAGNADRWFSGVPALPTKKSSTKPKSRKPSRRESAPGSSMSSMR